MVNYDTLFSRSLSSYALPEGFQEYQQADRPIITEVDAYHRQIVDSQRLIQEQARMQGYRATTPRDQRLSYEKSGAKSSLEDIPRITSDQIKKRFSSG